MPSTTSFRHIATSKLRLLTLTALSAAAAATLLLPSVSAGSSAPHFWHTAGREILDDQNRPVRISGLNWSGFETANRVPGGLDLQDYRAILRTIRANGYNTVRIPLSNEVVEAPTVPSRIAFENAQGSINADLRDLDSMEILDHIVRAARDAGLKVILDNHRSEAGSSAQESGLWYTDRYPESAWIADWQHLAARFQGDSTVIGMDLRNEPHNAARGGACWDCGGETDWHLAATRAGNAILRVNPRLLIFVEGVDEAGGSTTWWGGNLAGVRQSPIHLAIPGRLVYSAHVYGPTEYQQPWFNAATTPASLASLWRHDWAFISESNLAPVWIGEFGAPNTDTDLESRIPGSEGQWFSALVGFLQTHSAIGWTYWGANGEDRYALLDARYSPRPANPRKALALASISGSPAQPARSASSVASVETPASRSLTPTRSSLAASLLESIGYNRAARPSAAAPSTDAAITVVPVTPVSGSLNPEQRAAARRQVAQAWHPAAAPTPLPAPTPVQAASHPSDSSSDVEEALAEQVRRATTDALRHTEPGEER